MWGYYSNTYAEDKGWYEQGSFAIVPAEKEAAMEATKPVLAVDFDDILFDFNETFRNYHNTRYGTAYAFEDLKTYEIEKILGCDIPEKNRRILEFYHSREHVEGIVIPGALDSLELLSAWYSLHIVSARPDTVSEATHVWLEVNRSLQLFEKLHFTGHYHANAKSLKRLSKADICLELGAKVFIEDALHNAASVAQVGIPVLLYDKPWNQGELHPNITRVHSWSEIVSRLATQ